MRRSLVGEGAETVAQTERGAIEAHLAEGRRFPPPAAFASRRAMRDPRPTREAERDPAAFWQGTGAPRDHLVPGAGRDARRLQPAVLQVVRRRRAQRRLQLPRPAHRGGRRRQDRLMWIGEPGEERTITYLSCWTRSARPPARSRRSAWASGDRVAIYMAWCRSCRSRCWRAPASARRTPSCSAASRPRRWPAASRTPSARC